MFRKVLIANRGEIARRVMRTCRELGIRTVAVYSDADADAPHVHDADEAVRIGAAPAAESYLDVAAIVAAARRTGAEAIHPGYGFLSENPALPAACAAAGLTFVGPRPDTIELMGDKAAAKRHLEEAGVPVVPGVHDEALSDEQVRDAAERIGYPVLVKAVAGGGGKGMRAVRSADELGDALTAARREATAAFGDDRVILEKLVAAPRHVEIQVFGDAHGNVVHLFERECSVQRRHQKVVEEAPSPAVDAALRERMGAAAVRAAKAVDYLGAGTVEFLLSGETGEFYFIEMNTRLQVEHPVTELTTGTDLVEWQLRVAAGEPLPLSQDELTSTGHALEVRLYAEDPANGFLPQTGPVHRFVRPDGPGLRVDGGIEDGSEVSRFYDPMLAKLIVHADDRDAAIDRMAWLLDHTAVLGVTTNAGFLRDVVTHPVFRSGEITTGFLDEHLPDWSPPPAPLELLLAAAVALQDDRERGPARTGDGDPHSPWRALGPWRGGQVGGWVVTFSDGEREQTLTVTGRGGRYTVRAGGSSATARVLRGPDADGALHLELDGHEVPATVVIRDDTVFVHVRGTSRRLEVVPPTRHADIGVGAGGATFTSPMPGAVLTVEVAEGDHVTEGTTLVVVEAMKMEHPVKAPADGTVTALLVSPGDPVDGGAPLLEFAPDTED